MTKDDARAVIYATARKMFVGEDWHVSKTTYNDAFNHANKFSDPDFQIIDRTAFYVIRRIK